MIYNTIDAEIIPERVPLDLDSYYFALEACADAHMWREARGLLHLQTVRVAEEGGPKPDALVYNLVLRAHLNGLKDGSRASLDDVLEAMAVAGEPIDDDLLGIPWGAVVGLL